ncbi:MAG: hypothetical protein HY280_07120 [Nitrospinae bacterium]|nr:hypothetical protein [Nitrospinota bacterium]
MTGWLVFQLVFDVFVCVLVIVFVFRDAQTRKLIPDINGLKTLVEDFKKAVEKSEKAALNLDAQLKKANLPKPRAASPEQDEFAGAKIIAKGNGRPHIPQSNPMEEQKRQVVELYKQGLSKDEISRQLALPMSEVELMIAMLRKDD